MQNTHNATWHWLGCKSVWPRCFAAGPTFHHRTSHLESSLSHGEPAGPWAGMLKYAHWLLYRGRRIAQDTWAARASSSHSFRYYCWNLCHSWRSREGGLPGKQIALPNDTQMKLVRRCGTARIESTDQNRWAVVYCQSSVIEWLDSGRLFVYKNRWGQERACSSKIV